LDLGDGVGEAIGVAFPDLGEVPACSHNVRRYRTGPARVPSTSNTSTAV
jgi:hypothetical protein